MLKILLALLLFASPVCAAGPEIFFQSGGAASVPEWIYSGSATDDYPDNSGAQNTDVLLGTQITTPGSIDTAEKLSWKLQSAGSSTECWAGLYDTASPNARLAYSVFSPVTGWNDVTISYLYAASTEYNIWIGCNGTYTTAKNNSGTEPDYYSGSYSYNSTPPATISTADWTGSLAARLQH
jgi:hypothetical protein